MDTKNNDDYYFLPDGRLVFSEKYHLKRGYCCGSGCMNCPYDFNNVPSPRREDLKKQKLNNAENDGG